MLIIVSSKGRWQEVVDAAAMAGEQGATVVALTDPGSPLARSAAVVLPCTTIEDTSVYTPMSSRLAQLALLDALHVSLALSLGDEATDKLRASKSAILARFSG